MGMNGVAIVSGGLDSSTMLYELLSAGHRVTALSFDYGQRHRRELDAAAAICGKAGVTQLTVPLPALGLLTDEAGCALLGGTVPEGRYDDESMKATIVPNRNMVMIALAGSRAMAAGGTFVAAGMHAGDHAVYPDCRPAFVMAMETALAAATGNPDFLLLTPYLGKTKEDIAARAAFLGVPIGETWSCYQGGDIHCGRCGTCVERLEALHDAGVSDPTPYADTEYWKTQVNL